MKPVTVEEVVNENSKNISYKKTPGSDLDNWAIIRYCQEKEWQKISAALWMYYILMWWKMTKIIMILKYANHQMVIILLNINGTDNL